MHGLISAQFCIFSPSASFSLSVCFYQYFTHSSHFHDQILIMIDNYCFQQCCFFSAFFFFFISLSSLNSILHSTRSWVSLNPFRSPTVADLYRLCILIILRKCDSRQGFECDDYPFSLIKRTKFFVLRLIFTFTLLVQQGGGGVGKHGDEQRHNSFLFLYIDSVVVGVCVLETKFKAILSFPSAQFDLF